MRIFQLLSTISMGDAVSNDALAFADTLRKNGYKVDIYAEIVGQKLLSAKVANTMDKLPEIKKDDLVIYHFSTGTQLNFRIGAMPCKKIMVYHNVTPPSFMENYNPDAAELCSEGLKGAKFLADKVDYVLAVSEFNKQDLINMGYTCPIDVLPILIPFDDYKKEPDSKTFAKYSFNLIDKSKMLYSTDSLNQDVDSTASDRTVNILFTGRIAPNKCQQDVIKAFSAYQKNYNANSRLILVGNYDGMERYFGQLKMYADELEVENVIFTGHISFPAILAYYHMADVFLCQSEHEGFCVPLVEAMCFDIPIVAYDAAAIGETLNGSGVLLEEKDALVTAGVIDRIVRDKELKDVIIANQRERLADFAHDKIETKLMDLLKAYLS